MTLDTVDTIKSTFGSLAESTGMKVMALLFVAQLANMAGTMLYSSGTASTAMAVAGGVLTLLAAVASVLISIGAFRSFDTGTVEKEQYTDNILWPITRLLGANVVTTVFAYGVAFFAFLPVVAIAGLTGAGLSAGGIAGASAVIGVLAALGVIAGLAAFVYIFLMLILSVPMVAADDNRLFEALDKSVQRTSGNKVSMFLSALPVFLFYLLGLGVILALGPGPGATSISPVYALATAAVTSVIGTAFFSLLTEFNQRLPE